MKILISSLIAALVLLLSGCSSYADRDGKEISMTGGQVANPDKVTCKSVIKTGTRLGSRVCKTNQEWYRQSVEARRTAEKMQRKSGGGSPEDLGGG